VGIGTTSLTGTLNVGGYYYSGGSGTWTSSDIRYKENIATLANPIEKISKLRGVEFNWKPGTFNEPGISKRRQIGVIAQEIEKEFPLLVDTDAKGYKSVAYDRLSAVLLEAVKEQQKEIEELKGKIKALESKK